MSRRRAQIAILLALTPCSVFGYTVSALNTLVESNISYLVTGSVDGIGGLACGQGNGGMPGITQPTTVDFAINGQQVSSPTFSMFSPLNFLLDRDCQLPGIAAGTVSVRFEFTNYSATFPQAVGTVPTTGQKFFDTPLTYDESFDFRLSIAGAETMSGHAASGRGPEPAGEVFHVNTKYKCPLLSRRSQAVNATV